MLKKPAFGPVFFFCVNKTVQFITDRTAYPAFMTWAVNTKDRLPYFKIKYTAYKGLWWLSHK